MADDAATILKFAVEGLKELKETATILNELSKRNLELAKALKGVGRVKDPYSPITRSAKKATVSLDQLIEAARKARIATAASAAGLGATGTARGVTKGGVKDAGVGAYLSVEKTTAKTAANTAKTAQNLAKSGRQAKQLATHSRGILLSWHSIQRIIIGSTLARGIGLIMRQFSEMVTNAKEFQLRLGEIRTISQQNQLPIERWSSEVRQLSDLYGTDLLDTAEGFYQTLSNQIAHGAEAMQFMNEAQRFGVIALASTEDAVNLLSGTLNAYSLEVSDARDLSNQFFKTIELGRIRASELEHSFGQLAGVSAQLGIDTEEVNASLATLTRRGIRANLATTGFRNVMLKLIRPSEKMKDLFREWGVETGQSAIQSFKFIGVLRKLAEHAEATGEPLEAVAELFQRIRAIVGGAPLVSAFEEVEDNLVKIKESAETANKAFEDMRKNLGFQFRKELQKVANIFTVDFGKKFLTVFLNLNKTIGGLNNAIIVLSKILKALATTGGIFLVIKGVTALTPLLSLLKWALLGDAVAVALLQKRMLTLKATLLTMPNALLAIGVASYIVFDAIFDHIERSKKKLIEFADEGTRAIKELHDRWAAASADVTSRSATNLIDAAHRLQQFVKGSYADLRAEINKMLDVQARQLLSEKKLFDIEMARAKLSKSSVSRNIAIDSHGRPIAGKDDGPKTETFLVKQRLNTLLARIESVAKAAAAANAANKKYTIPKGFDKEADELQDLILQYDKLKKARDGSIRRIGADGLGTTRGSDRLQSTDDYLKKLNELVEQVHAVRDAEFGDLRARNIVEEFKLRTEAIEANIVKFDELIFKIEEAGKRFEDFNRAAGTNAGEMEQNLDLLRNAALPSIAQVAYNLIRSKTLEGAAQNAVFHQEREGIRGFITDLEDLITAGKAVGATFDTAKIEEKSAALMNALLNSTTISGPKINEFLTFFGKAEGALISNATEASRLSDEVDRLKTELVSTSGATVGLSQMLAIDPASETKFNDLLAKLDGMVNVTSTINSNMQGAFNALDSTRTTEVKDSMSAVETITGGIAKNLSNAFRDAETWLRAAASYNLIKGDPNFKGATGTWTGGNISRFAGGGSVASDSIQALLSPGEFVMNKSAARKFLPSLVAMNSGAARFNTGGETVNNNVGDVNVTVQGGNSSENTARSIAQALRREIRRGTARLN